MTKRMKILVCLLAVLMLAAPATAAGPMESGMQVTPDRVDVNLFFGGSMIRVDGWVPQGCDAVVIWQGAEKEIHLKKKGKVGGVLWMNVGEVSFEHVPSVYTLDSSRPVADLAPAGVLEKLGVGYKAIEAASLAGSGDRDEAALFGELIKLKEEEKLFHVDESGVELTPQANGPSKFTASFWLPPDTPIGTYTVRLLSFRDGQGAEIAENTIEVRRTGVVALTTTLAHRHGLLYGILAVIIALVAGLLTGMIFGLGSKGGH